MACPQEAAGLGTGLGTSHCHLGSPGYKGLLGGAPNPGQGGRGARKRASREVSVSAKEEEEDGGKGKEDSGEGWEIGAAWGPFWLA